MKHIGMSKNGTERIKNKLDFETMKRISNIKNKKRYFYGFLLRCAKRVLFFFLRGIISSSSSINICLKLSR